LRWMPGIRRPSTSRSICWPILKTYLVRLSVCGDGRVISRYSGTPGRSSPAAQVDRVIPREVGDFFHHLRAVGNQATHENDGTHAEALTALKIARELGIWFYRSFGGGKSFSPGAFVPPPDPTAATQPKVSTGKESARKPSRRSKYPCVCFTGCPATPKHRAKQIFHL
jgi:hypothetical protein